MRNLKSLFGIILGMLLTMPFLTACGDDESIDLGTPKYESISGKYTINNPSSPYKSIELGAGGDYIVTLNTDITPIYPQKSHSIKKHTVFSDNLKLKAVRPTTMVLFMDNTLKTQMGH